MGDIIKYDLNKMRNTAKIINQYCNQIESIIKSVDRTINDICYSWEGLSYSGFMDNYRVIRPSMNSFINILNDLYKDLVDAADKMEEKDKELADLHISITTDGILGAVVGGNVISALKNTDTVTNSETTFTSWADFKQLDAKVTNSQINSSNDKGIIKANPIQNVIDGVEDISSDAVDWTKNNYRKLIDDFSDKLNSTGAAIIGSSAGAVSEIQRVTKIFINENNVIQFYPKSSIAQTMKPFGRIAKVGTFITAISSATQIITTWTDNNNNTFAQKLEKNGVQLVGTVVGLGAGALNTVVVVALGFVEPETGGLSTAGIIMTVGLDVAEGEGIQLIQKKVYEIMGIEDK